MDTYIDQHETLAYGPFAVQQIKELVVGLDPAFDGTLVHVGGLVSEASVRMKTALQRAGDVDITTYSAQGDTDPVARGRDLLRRLVKYAESRPGGDVIADSILNGETLTVAMRRRPAKLSGALAHALTGVEKHKDALDEWKAWSSDLKKTVKALDELNTSVRKSREARRSMTPEVQAARAAWLTAYGAAKLVVEAVLRLHGKTRLMSEVFDDLAEVHRVAGVTDNPPPAGSPPEGSVAAAKSVAAEKA